MVSFHIGRSRVEKIHEFDLDGFTLTRLLPALDPGAAGRHADWVPAGTYDAGTGLVPLSVHSWLLRHEGMVVLIDAGAGNDKPRPGLKVLDHLHHPFLQNLEAAGVRPEDVDFVLHTHLHADHVGWNTVLRGGGWVPTFPNATTICSGLEWRYQAALAAGDEAGLRAARAEAGLGEPIRVGVTGPFADSMAPLEPTGRLRRVEVGGGEVLPGIRFLAAAGHSIDHAVIEVRSGGEVGLFGGDLMHHPAEIYDPALLSMFCEFPDAARRSRRDILGRAADSGAVYFSAHFPLSSTGRVDRAGEGFGWSFADAGPE